MATLHRRLFLQSTAAFAGMGMLGATVRAAESKRKFTMALSCGAIGVAADPRAAIDLAFRHGFEAVEPSADFLGSLSQGQLEELLAELKAKKLVWGAAGLPLEFRADQSTFEQGMKTLPQFAKSLQRGGVTRVGTWLMPVHKSLTFLANFRQHAQRLREAAKVLDDHGLRLGLEYVGPKTSWIAGRFPFIHTMAEMKELIAEIGCGNVGFMLDSWHWYTAHETEADILSLRAADVVCCHLNDAPKGIPIDEQKDTKRDLPAATGVIDVKTFLGALAKIGYDGPIMAEPFRGDLGAMPRNQAVAAVAASMKKAFALL